MLAALWQSLHFFPVFKIFWKSLAASVVMVVILWLLKSVNLFVLLVVALAVYFSALYLLKGFSWNEVSALVKKDNVS